MSVTSEYFIKFDAVSDKYMPERGEGDTKASQIVTAVNNLLYGWFNNGDVFDTKDRNEWAEEHCSNDISSYANWLAEFADLYKILSGIYKCDTEDDYRELLKTLADTTLNEEYLAPYATQSKEGTIYKCDGEFEYIIHYDDEEEEYEDEE